MKKGSSAPITEYMKTIRVLQFIVVDALMIAFTYGLIVFFLHLTGVETYDPVSTVFVLPAIIFFKINFYYANKLYKLVLDNVGIDEVFKIFVIVTISNVFIVIMWLIFPGHSIIPLYFFIFITPFEALLMSLTRLTKRLLKMVAIRFRVSSGKRTMIIGAGAGGKLVLNELRNNDLFSNNVVAFVDDDPMKIGKTMSDVRIFGPVSEVPQLIDKLAIEEVIIAIAAIDSKRFQEIVKKVAERPVKIRRLPLFNDLKKDMPKHLLEVNVEDLLGRDVVDLDTDGITEFIRDKRVIVTGAGGSIGSELVRQILGFQPESILLLDFYENGVYDLQMELNRTYPFEYLHPIPRKVLIASVYNYDRMHKIFADYKPQLVFHAAAYKHVPLMEDSSIEAVRTNVIGTYNICKLSHEFGVEKMVLVSSDKAVRPTNVMGATKRFAEMILQHFNHTSDTAYSAVRFGNVLGSNGSVVPLFKRQIEAGGPVTVTDRNIIRYFMTIPEAVGLILQSGAFAKGGEIFILDMGDPVKILDLAEKMIMLAGRKPYIDIDIVITGLRPGEKLYEELLVDKDGDHIQTANKKIFIEGVQDVRDVEEEIASIQSILDELNNTEVKELVKKYVPTYTIKK